MTKAERLQIECDRLNAEIPVGTFVHYWPVSGPYFHAYRPNVTPITAEFEVRGGRVIGWVEVQRGFVDASHIEPDACYADEKAHYKWITKFSKP